MGQPVLLVAGARPNFMKLAPVQRALSNRINDVIVVHTGQHYDHIMSQVFFDELEIPVPDIHLGVGSGTHASQTAKIMIQFEQLCHEISPSMVVVFGDVNSTVACSLVAAKMGIPVAHVESGLRSNDRSMPEEINRIITDHLSTLLFTTTNYANENLISEGISMDKIALVGNVMIDTLIQQTPSIDKSKILDKLQIKSGDFDVLTLHRPANVDDPIKLETLLTQISAIETEKQMIFPVHPRTKTRIKDLDLEGLIKKFTIIEPLGYHDFSKLLKNANSVWTDSGGIQEECTFYGVSCFTLRDNTERPESFHSGTNRLVSMEDNFTEIYNKIESKVPTEIPFWDGNSAIRISEIIVKHLEVK